MTAALFRRTFVALLYVATALFACASSGCLAAAIGACAGGAGVCAHAYCKGKVIQVYVADLNDAYAAAKTSLTELGLPVEKEKVNDDHIVIRSRSGDGDRIRIDLCRQASQIPADGAVTEIGVRVGTFGNHPLSDRVLYQIGSHLVAPGAVRPTPVLSAAPAPPPTTPSLQPPQPAPMPPLAPMPRPVEPPLGR